MSPADTSRHSAGGLKSKGQFMPEVPTTSHCQTTAVTIVYVNLFKTASVSLQCILETIVLILSLSDCSVFGFIVHLHNQNRKIFNFFQIFIHSPSVLCAWRPIQLFLTTMNLCLPYNWNPSHSDLIIRFGNITEKTRQEIIFPKMTADKVLKVS